MKLTDIDLSDKTEVAAAYALLAAVLGEAIPVANHVGEQASLSPSDAQPMQDAAAVFGAVPLPAFGAPAPASAPPVSGGTLAAPGAGGLPPQAFVSNEGAASGLRGLGQPAAGVELDSRGLPWDARIHASTKSKTKAGEWTKLRGFNDEAKLKAIEAELRATVQGQQPGAAVPAQGVALLAGIPFSSANNALPQSTLPATGIGATAQTTPVADPMTFEQLMPRVTQATISGILPPTALQHVCGALGLPSVVALQTNPASIPQAWAQLRAAYPALQ